MMADERPIIIIIVVAVVVVVVVALYTLEYILYLHDIHTTTATAIFILLGVLVFL